MMRASDIAADDFGPGLRLRIAAYIAAIGPDRHIPWGDLAELCWGRRCDGGPDQWREQLRVHVSHIRRALRPGWKIEKAYLGGVVLRRAEQARAAA